MRKRIAARIAALEQRKRGDNRLFLEIDANGDAAAIAAAIADWRRGHGGQPPTLILDVPARGYEPAYP